MVLFKSDISPEFNFTHFFTLTHRSVHRSAKATHDLIKKFGRKQQQKNCSVADWCKQSLLQPHLVCMAKCKISSGTTGFSQNQINFRTTGFDFLILSSRLPEEFNFFWVSLSSIQSHVQGWLTHSIGYIELHFICCSFLFYFN